MSIARNVIYPTALLCVAAAPVRGALLGWGVYRFDMSRAQVAEAGVGKLTTNEYGVMMGKVIIGGALFNFAIKFKNDDTSVSYIGVGKDGISALDESSCLREGLALEKQITGKYGPPDIERAPKEYTENGMNSIIYTTTYTFSNGSKIEVETGIDRTRSGVSLGLGCQVNAVYKPGDRIERGAF